MAQVFLIVAISLTQSPRLLQAIVASQKEHRIKVLQPVEAQDSSSNDSDSE